MSDENQNPTERELAAIASMKSEIERLCAEEAKLIAKASASQVTDLIKDTVTFTKGFDVSPAETAKRQALDSCGDNPTATQRIRCLEQGLEETARRACERLRQWDFVVRVLNSNPERNCDVSNELLNLVSDLQSHWRQVEEAARARPEVLSLGIIG